MLITEGFGTGQLLITEGFGTSIEEIGYPIGERIVKIRQVGTPIIVGKRLSSRGQTSDMWEAA